MMKSMLFGLFAVGSASVDHFGKIRMPRFEKLVGSEVDLAGPIAVDSEKDCTDLCRVASFFASPTRQYDAYCDFADIYADGQCFLSEIPTLQEFIVDKTGSRALSCRALCSFMSDCMVVQTESKITRRMTSRTCSFFNGYVEVQRTRFPVEVEMKQTMFEKYIQM
ncbi:Oidioi.mRNA.OKI2018_I69.chr2.g5072.t1.cds [Oikopleura dioica]|uniref:Oidioi.mRNA.OKI2018_I69.chr2.g5072.t1.cds n=1 Tax=Oikopleura dioica TaxID=34765 RepID=A0ABN7SZE6_OIKDI|nr:Oidioi.mRNA.OKI2018_I69.chr2.g5072.t1.cds [Oikopleura dioica]